MRPIPQRTFQAPSLSRQERLVETAGIFAAGAAAPAQQQDVFDVFAEQQSLMGTPHILINSFSSSSIILSFCSIIFSFCSIISLFW